MSHPEFYRPEQVGQVYAPDVARVTAAAASAGVTPSTADTQRTLLLLVDAQIDFIHPDGGLPVPGAIEDTRRLIAWMYAHTGHITTIAASLDSHVPVQIFYPTWWVDMGGQQPEPYTVITHDDVSAGVWRPVYEPEWSRQYVATLENDARKQLMIWPYHTMVGTQGHNLVPPLYEAIAYHSVARQAQPIFHHKGMLPYTEYYSLLEPEVKVPGHPLGEADTDFIEMIGSYDRVYIAGQAKSHCVLQTTISLMNAFADQPEQISRLYLLTDGMSSVAHPEIDFDAQANATLAEFAAQGLHLVTTQDAL